MTDQGTRRFRVWSALPFTYKSAGVRGLYALRDELRARGQIVTEGRSSGPEVVHVVPEDTPDLPTGTTVRWLLSAHRQLPPAPNDCTWHTELFPDAQFLRVDLIDPSVFYYEDGWRPESVVCTGKDPSMPRQTMPGVQITRDWPESPAEMGDLLRRSCVLYQYDVMSHVTLEAVLCGCPVLLMYPDPPVSHKGIPGVFWHLEQLPEAREAVKGAGEWYEAQKARYSASVDAFVERWA